MSLCKVDRIIDGIVYSLDRAPNKTDGRRVARAGSICGTPDGAYVNIGSRKHPKWLPLDGVTTMEAERTPDTEWVPTTQDVVDRMLEIANPTPADVLYDLGCGDGRIVITAVRRYGCRAVGIDLDPRRIGVAKENSRCMGVDHMTEFRLKDLFKVDFSDSTIITLYLTRSMNLTLVPKFRALRDGVRIVAHDFSMGVTPHNVHRFRAEDGAVHVLMSWTTPLDG